MRAFHLWSWLLLSAAPLVLAVATLTDALQPCELEAQHQIAKAKRLIHRANSYKPSRETAHKKAVFAQRLRKWEAIARAAKHDPQHCGQSEAFNSFARLASGDTRNGAGSSRPLLQVQLGRPRRER